MPLVDKFNKVSNGSQALPTTLSADKNAGAATASLNAATGWDTTTAKHIRMYKTKIVNGSTVPDTTQLCYYKATLAGTTLSSITLIFSSTGVDQKFVIGDTVDQSPTTRWADDLVDGILTSLNQDGTVKAGAISAATMVADGILTAAKSTASTNIETRGLETIFDHVASGCVITGTGYGTTLGWSMTLGVVYIGGKRLTVAAATGTVTASKDTYFDLLDPGTGTVATLVNTSGNIVTNNTASPTLAALSVRIGIVVSAATIVAVTSINQGQETMILPIVSSIPYAVTDSLGNLICSRDPNRKILGQRQIVSGFAGASTSIAPITGLSCPVNVPAGRKCIITFFVPWLTGSTTLTTDLYIYDGVPGVGTKLSQSAYQISNSQITNGYVTVTVTPTASPKTYTAGYDVGGGTLTINASSTNPTLIRVELA